MSLHPSKTKCMLIGSANKIKSIGNLELFINDAKLVNVVVQKLLGVYIDNTLNWHVQIDNVCKNLNRKIALLKNIIYFLTPDMKLLFYNAYILPIFDYGCLVWGKGTNSYVNKINSLQKRIAKIILGKSKRAPSTDLFKELKWLNFSDRCRYHSAVLVYKTLNNMAPSYMSEIVSFSENNLYMLRSITNKDLVLQTRPRTNYMTSSFSYYSRNVWNAIALEIRESENIKTFKIKLKQNLIGE